MNHLPSYLLITEILAYSFVLLAEFAVIGVLWLHICDKLQTKQAIRHNFPVIGRLPYVFEHWVTFFFQDFIVKKYDL